MDPSFPPLASFLPTGAPVGVGGANAVDLWTPPLIASLVFANAPDARFAVGEVERADSERGRLLEEFDGAAALRARTYLAKGFIEEGDLDHDGTELDIDDLRAAHFMVLERGVESGKAQVVGTMRLVIKTVEQPAPLPVERFFPEVFEDDPLPALSYEVSRLIGRHENAAIQQWIKWPLFIAGSRFITRRGYSRVVGLLAPDLAARFARTGVPLRPIAPAKYIDEIRATKQPVAIDMNELDMVIGRLNHGQDDVERGQFSFVTPMRMR